jgi:glutamate racemase
MQSILIALASLAAAVGANPSPEKIAAKLAEKDALSVVVIDSGLGGLSVCARLEALAVKRPVYPRLQLAFCNALPGDGKGYNDLPDELTKAAVFSRALEGIASTCRPDLILIACNTLSVVYPHTDFSRRTQFPVVGIVDTAVDLFAEKLQGDNTAAIVLFGTETTIGSHVYKAKLEAKGIAAARIVEQPCPKLESEIQLDPASDVTTTFIDWYVGEAAEKLGSRPAKVFAALCCTHYGYAAATFAKSLHAAGLPAEVLNPNERMGDFLFPPARRAARATETSVRTLSRAAISDEERRAIAAALKPVSAKTAASLLSYEHRKDLF